MSDQPFKAGDRVTLRDRSTPVMFVTSKNYCARCLDKGGRLRDSELPHEVWVGWFDDDKHWHTTLMPAAALDLA
jgi:hypothetical protein